MIRIPSVCFQIPMFDSAGYFPGSQVRRERRRRRKERVQSKRRLFGDDGPILSRWACPTCAFLNSSLMTPLLTSCRWYSTLVSCSSINACSFSSSCSTSLSKCSCNEPMVRPSALILDSSRSPSLRTRRTAVVRTRSACSANCVTRRDSRASSSRCW